MSKYTWDLTKIYADEEAFQEDVALVRGLIDKINKEKDEFKENFSSLLKDIIQAREKSAKLYAYAKMNQDGDTRDAIYQRLVLEATLLSDDLSSAASFFRPELLALNQEELNGLIYEGQLEEYRDYLEKIYRYRPHTLSIGEEHVFSELGQLADSAASAYYFLSNADTVFPEIESKGGERLTNANYVNLLKDPDVKVRKEAFDAMYSTLAGQENTMASLMYSNVRGLTIQARLREFPSAREMELFADDVDKEVYDTLVDVVRNTLPAYKDYYQLKKDFLGLDDQHMYDVYLPTAENFKMEVPYEEAVEILLEALKPLGEDYVKVLARAFEENWIDVYPREGKASGAYSWGVYDSDPYILMNYTDDLNSLFTLAHELGHSIHSYYSRKENPFIYSDYTIFVAEVASTTNELLLLDYMFKNAESDEERLYLVNHYLDSFKGTVFRQTMFSEFEKQTHDIVEAGEALTLDKLNEIYYQLNLDYFEGPVVVDDEIKMEWMRIPHFYRNFYVYKYATGFSTSVKLAQNILSGEGPKLEAYLDFLKDGGRNFPIDQLRDAGADISKVETMEAAMDVFVEQVDILRELIG